MNQSPSHSRSGGNPITAVVWIGLGVIFLLNNFGVISWSIWESLWRFWPIFIIIYGFELMAGGSRLLLFFVALLAAVLMALAVLTAADIVHAPGISSDQGKTKTQTITSDQYSGSSNRSVTIKSGVGTLTVQDVDDDTVASVTGKAYGQPEPTLVQTEENGVVRVGIEANNRGFWINDLPEATVIIGRPSLSTQLDIDSGAGTTKVALSKLVITKYSLKVGAGSADVTFAEPSLPSEGGTITVGAGKAALSLPSAVGLRISYQAGVGRIKVGDTSLSGNGTYETPGYADAETKVSFDLQVGAGTIAINR